LKNEDGGYELKNGGGSVMMVDMNNDGGYELKNETPTASPYLEQTQTPHSQWNQLKTES